MAIRPIIKDILTLTAYLSQLKTDITRFKPAQCPHCGLKGLWNHGHYSRKPDRNKDSTDNLNPVPIQRYLCPHCRHTCSTLPECIPAKRWYLWSVQQAVIALVLLGKSVYQSSQCTQLCWRTVSRWVAWLIADKFVPYAFRLKSKIPWLGRTNDALSFWSACFDKMSLSAAMRYLNALGEIVP